MRKIELLAPGGDVDAVKAAILAGADAVYCGLEKFNARNRASNLSFEDLQGLVRLAHKSHCKVFLTLNIIITDAEIPALIKWLNRLLYIHIDGLIVQDFGLLYLLSEYFKSFKIHASTQLTTHNEGQIEFLSKLNAQRVNLSRELNIDEIKSLNTIAHKNNILTEVFVHGSYCISFSGICYMSSVHGGNSGNRGRCSQPCRDKYIRTAEGTEYPLNLKDNSAYFNLKELYDAGIDSLKIEGRIKDYEYVYTTVAAWRKQIQRFYDKNSLLNDDSDLYKVFNRNFSNAYLKGDIHKDMFIDKSGNHAVDHFFAINNYSSKEEREQGLIEFYDEKEKLKTFIKNKTATFDIAKIPLEINISGSCDTALKISVKTPESSFEILSDSNLTDSGSDALNHKMLLKRLNAINDTGYFIKTMEFRLDTALYLPFKELTSLKKRILFILNGSEEIPAAVNVPVLKKNKETDSPELSVLISSAKDLNLCNDSSAEIWFQLPDGFKNAKTELTDLFKKNKNLLPWFPSVFIGDDYQAAVEFLEELQPKRIVSNNSGIAYEAFKKGISWIAGPHLNITNSFSLSGLKENFLCNGAFLSNELSKQQILLLKRPEDFRLYYIMYQPLVLMTSRQCLFHQVSGCEKDKVDVDCMLQCERYASITNLKKETFIIEKSKGNYNRVFNSSNLLNTDIVTDIPDLFSGFLVDLRDIKTETKIESDKATIIRLFKKHLSGDADSGQQLQDMIHPTNNIQYNTGI